MNKNNRHNFIPNKNLWVISVHEVAARQIHCQHSWCQVWCENGWLSLSEYPDILLTNLRRNVCLFNMVSSGCPSLQESYTCERLIFVLQLVCTEAAIFVSMRHWHNPEHVASLSACILGKSYRETTHYFLGGKGKKKRKMTLMTKNTGKEKVT